MPPTQHYKLPQKEARLALSKQAIQTKQISSFRRAARLYSIPRSTLQSRVNGILPQAQTNARKRKLQPTEEQSLIQ